MAVGVLATAVGVLASAVVRLASPAVGVLASPAVSCFLLRRQCVRVSQALALALALALAPALGLGLALSLVPLAVAVLAGILLLGLLLLLPRVLVPGTVAVLAGVLLQGVQRGVQLEVEPPGDPVRASLVFETWNRLCFSFVVAPHHPETELEFGQRWIASVDPT